MRITIELQEPEAVRRPAAGSFLADFGKAAFGRLEVIVEAARECTAEAAIGEVLDADGRIAREPGGYRCFKSMEIALKPGVNRFFMAIPKHRSPYQATYQRSKVLTPENLGGEIAPFRYAELSGDTIVSVRWVRHAAFGPFDDRAAEFECSDPALNRVWEFCKYSIKATGAFGIFIDGERERQAFEGDSYINMLGAYCTGGGCEVARRTLEFMIEFYPIPAIEYRLIAPRLVRDYLLYSGDRRSCELWLRSLPERLCPDYLNREGLLENPEFIAIDDYRAEIPYQYFPLFPDPMQLLVDWPPKERDDYDFGPVNFVSNVFYFDALRMLHELAPGDGYGARAGALRAKMLKLFRRADGSYGDHAGSSHMALHTAVLALALDLAEEGDRKGLADFIVSRGMKCSVYMAQFLLDACFRSGRAQYAIDLMRSEGPRSWLNMLKQGSTISMEAWSNADKPNQDWNHAWGAAPANVIPRRLCGIRPTAPGFTEFVVDPQPGDLAAFHCVQPTPHGAVVLDWDKGTLRLVVPQGASCRCRGRVYAPGEHILR